MRTQIPIHCYIEQLDACANVSTFSPSNLSDDNLFNTTNSAHLNSTSHLSNSLQLNNSVQLNNNISHLNLSNSLNSSNSFHLNHPHNNNNNNTKNKPSNGSSNNINSFLNQSNNYNQNHNNNTNLHQHHPTPHLNQSKLALESVTNGSLASSLIPNPPISRSASVFTENASTDDNNDIDALDFNLDHLNPDSPLSLNQLPSQINTPTQPSLLNNSLQSNNICENNNNSPNNQIHNNQFSSSYDNQQFQSYRETYAIITSNVLYIDLVRTVLLQLGYSAMDLINAKATLQIKNWLPLALDQVTDDKRATVGEVLGDISTFVTLRIRLYSPVTQLPTEWTETMIRQVVLALTQTMSQLTLSKLCNISQPLISSIVRGGKKLGRRKCAEFGQWYMNYIKSADAQPSTMFCEGSSARLVFDKSREIPQLKAWFAINTKPSDELLEEYSRILNEHALRKDRPQVTGKALKNWWKNERQKLGIRQREFRGRPKLKQID